MRYNHVLVWFSPHHELPYTSNRIYTCSKTMKSCPTRGKNLWKGSDTTCELNRRKSKLIVKTKWRRHYWTNNLHCKGEKALNNVVKIQLVKCYWQHRKTTLCLCGGCCYWNLNIYFFFYSIEEIQTNIMVATCMLWVKILLYSCNYTS